MKGVDGNLQNKVFLAEMSAEFFPLSCQADGLGLKKDMVLEELLGILGSRIGRG